MDSDALMFVVTIELFNTYILAGYLFKDYMALVVGLEKKKIYSDFGIVLISYLFGWIVTTSSWNIIASRAIFIVLKKL